MVSAIASSADSQELVEDRLNDDGTKRFHDLCDQVSVLGKANLGKIEVLEKRKETRVIIGYDYSLECVLTDVSRDENRDDLGKKVTTPVCRLHTDHKTKPAEDIFRSWRYSGDALQKEILFGEKLDLSLIVFEDLVRLATEFQALGDKFNKFMVSGPETFCSISNIFTNMCLIEAALDEVEKLTTDAVDQIGESKEFKDGMDRIISGYYEVSRVFPGISLEMSGDISGSNDDIEQSSVVTKPDISKDVLNILDHTFKSTLGKFDNFCV